MDSHRSPTSGVLIQRPILPVGSPAVYYNSNLLVVDDEPVVCESCRRIFTSRGYNVETSTDPRAALKLAQSQSFDAILLDIQMPVVNGIEFLKELRLKNTSVPVIMITGYSSVTSAAAAMRLGASDYVTKPFSLEEITSALDRTLGKPAGAELSTTLHEEGKRVVPEAKLPKRNVAVAEPEVVCKPDTFYFLDEAWLLADEDGTVRVGTSLSVTDESSLSRLHLPKLGDVVHRGLPMASFRIGQTTHTIPAPVNGAVIATNSGGLNTADADAQASSRHGEKWLLRIRPSNLAGDMSHCRTHELILAANSVRQSSRLASNLKQLGTQVHTVSSASGAVEMVSQRVADVVVVDAVSFGEAGPVLVRNIRRANGDARVIVIGGEGAAPESAYREAGILYYAVEPLDPAEVREILVAAYRRNVTTPSTPRMVDSGRQMVHGIRVRTRDGSRVSLMPVGTKLLSDAGLGAALRRRVLESRLPMETLFGSDAVTPVQLVREANACDRLVLLVARDSGHLPGSLTRSFNDPILNEIGPADLERVTLAIQPHGSGDSAVDFDVKTIQALAEHIVAQAMR